LQIFHDVQAAVRGEASDSPFTQSCRNLLQPLGAEDAGGG
jgi:hypothetical protein